MSFKIIGKLSNKLMINDNIVKDNCKEIYNNGKQLIINDCNNSNTNNDFLNYIYANIASSRPMYNRLKEDFYLKDKLHNLNSIPNFIIKPFYIANSLHNSSIKKKYIKNKKKNTTNKKKNKKNK